MSLEIVELLFNKNKEEINMIKENMSNLKEDSDVSSFTYSFVESTLAEANEFPLTKLQIRLITNARKPGEGAGLGTGLPAFYDSNSSQWLDFAGNVIMV